MKYTTKYLNLAFVIVSLLVSACGGSPRNTKPWAKTSSQKIKEVSKLTVQTIFTEFRSGWTQPTTDSKGRIYWAGPLDADGKVSGISRFLPDGTLDQDFQKKSEDLFKKIAPDGVGSIIYIFVKGDEVHAATIKDIIFLSLDLSQNDNPLDLKIDRLANNDTERLYMLNFDEVLLAERKSEDGYKIKKYLIYQTPETNLPREQVNRFGDEKNEVQISGSRDNRPLELLAVREQHSKLSFVLGNRDMTAVMRMNSTGASSEIVSADIPVLNSYLPVSTFILADQSQLIYGGAIVTKLDANGKIDARFGNEGTFTFNQGSRDTIEINRILKTAQAFYLLATKFSRPLNQTYWELIKLSLDGSNPVEVFSYAYPDYVDRTTAANYFVFDSKGKWSGMIAGSVIKAGVNHAALFKIANLDTQSQ